MQFRISTCVYPRGRTRKVCAFQTELFVTDLNVRCERSSSVKNNWSCFSFASNYTKTFWDTGLCCLHLSKRQYQDGLTRGSERTLPKTHMQLLSMRTGWPPAPGQHSLRRTEA